MRILLINHRYGKVGGPERYLFNLKALLESKHHEVIPFSINYPINEPSDYSNYFASPLSDDASLYFRKQTWNVNSVIKTLERNFYSREVEEKLTTLISDTRPAFAIVLLYLRKLSPSVIVALRKMGIPFVVRLSDFGMMCPAGTFYRDNGTCELCANGNVINSVIHKCVHDSYGASLVNYLATKYHQAKGYFDLIENFASPTRFLMDKMTSAGWTTQRLFHLPTFAEHFPADTESVRKEQILYAGRLEHIKGVHVLLQAMRIVQREYGFPVGLKLAGGGDEAYVDSLRRYCEGNSVGDVEFVGSLNKDELMSLYSESLFSVIPSLWYDNLPNSGLESLSAGTPVIASNHGCFPELVTSGRNGLLFAPGSAEDLANAMIALLTDRVRLEEMRGGALAGFRDFFSPEKHYETLMHVVETIRLKSV